jgi:N6-adenosine-specific RNA methylase IME4/ParB-like chromosome segregation protein Spo0J
MTKQEVGEQRYQLLPELSAADYEALKHDIAARGVMVPIEYDEAGAVLDGHHRIQACQELGIREWPRIVRGFPSEAEKRTHVRQLNLARRHLNQQQRRELIAAELRDKPERSNRRVAAALGVDDKTVGVVREELISTAEIPQLTSTVGADGRSRTASRPKLTALDFGTDGQKATTTAAKQIRIRKGEVRRAARIERLVEASKGNAPLNLNQTYPIILADPPWRYDHLPMGPSSVCENFYPTMALDDICALPIANLATPDAVLFLWAPAPLVFQAGSVLNAWGAVYRTNLVWVKHRPGLGFWARQQHELLLVATFGDPPTPSPHSVPSSVINAPRREHSRKPDEAYELIERMYPDLPKIELFARSARKGWTAWGNQAPPHQSEDAA